MSENKMIPLEVECGEDGGIFLVPIKTNDFLVYGGDSGVLRVLESKKEVMRMDDPITACAYSVEKDQLSVGCEDGSVIIYHQNASHHLLNTSKKDDSDEDDFFSQTSHEEDENIMWRLPRKESPIRDFLFHGQRLFVATESGLYLLDLSNSNDGSIPEWQSTKVTTGVSSITALNDDQLVVCGMTGTVTMYSIDGWKINQEWKQMSPKDIGVGAHDVSDLVGRVCTGGDYVYVPSTKLQYFDGQEFQPLPSNQSRHTCAAFIEKKYLAVASSTNTLQLHSLTQANIPVELGTYDQVITQLLYQTESQKLFVVFQNSQLQIIPLHKYIESAKEAIVVKEKETTVSEEEPKETSTEMPKTTKRLASKKNKGDDDDDDDDDENDMFDSVDVNSNVTKKVIFDDDDDDNKPEDDTKNLFTDEAQEDGDNDKNEMNDVEFEASKINFNDNDEDDDVNDDIQQVDEESVGGPRQEPFAPAAAPDILCWNHEGTITTTEMAQKRKIYIHFSNAIVRKPISFIDTEYFTQGSLGSDGAIFISENNSVYFTNGTDDWFCILPNKERPVGCATGKGWAAVISDSHHLRLYSSRGGVETHIRWTKGPYVTCVGRDKYLAVVHFTNNREELGFTLYNGLTGMEVYSGQLCAISPGGTLTWIGFGNDLALCAYDSHGQLSMFHPSHSAWIPFTFGKKNHEHLWPITVTDGKFSAIHLRGGQSYPVGSPMPTVFRVQLPVSLNSSMKFEKLEETSLRASCAMHHRHFTLGKEENLCANVDKVTLKLYIHHCEAGNTNKALDIVQHRLFLETSYDIAVTIADRMSLPTLANDILNIKETKFDTQDNETDSEEEERDEEDNDASVTPMETQHPISPESNHLKREREHEENHSNKRLRNPFAKKKVLSPRKESPHLPTVSEEAQLSRQATFTQTSRKMRQSDKHIL